MKKCVRKQKIKYLTEKKTRKKNRKKVGETRIKKKLTQNEKKKFKIKSALKKRKKT